MIIKAITGGHDGKKSLDVTSFLLNAIPYFLAAAMMVGVGKSMYILKDRLYHSFIIFIAAILLGSTLTLSYNDGNGNMWGVFAQLSLYYMFAGGANIFEVVSASYLSQGGKAAGGYALINAIKSSSSIVSGPLIGWLSDIKGGNTQAIPTLSIFTALALVLLVLFYVIEGNFMDAIYGRAGAGGGGGTDSTDNSKSDESRSDSNDESSTSNNSYNIDIIRICDEE